MGKIMVIGDSIVYGKWDSQGGWVARLRRYIDEEYNLGKGGNLQVYNLGIPGEVVIRMVRRVKNELQMRVTDPEDHNLVLVAVGVNDSCPNNWMTNRQTPKEEFVKAYKETIQTAIRLGCKVACVGLLPVNPGKSKGLQFTNEEVMKYDGYISEICKELKVSKIELFEKLQKTDFREHLVDSVHPDDKGHEIVYEKIKMWLEKKGLLEWVK